MAGELSRDRRRARRRAARYLRFFAPVPGTILNLSALGMCLETLTEMQQGAEYCFRIRHRSRLLKLEGRVKWCRLRSTLASSNGKSLSLFRAGIALSRELDARDLRFLTSGEAVSGLRPAEVATALRRPLEDPT